MKKNNSKKRASKYVNYSQNGLERFFTKDGQTAEDVFNSVEWSTRDAKITDAQGNVAFEQTGMEFPASWSDTAVKVVASKYFKGKHGSDRRESSVRQLVSRVVNEITEWGGRLGHLSDEEIEVFKAELTFLLVNQYGCFNSPVWFNVGIKDQPSAGWVWDEYLGQVRRVREGEHRPQCSACFIVEVQDNMESILDWVKTEGMIFKFGSGSGVNVSTIRSTKEYLSSGGKPSGPLSFMMINDTAAGSIKSGGKHRRAAKMVVLNADHPDILDFISSKVEAEDLADKFVGIGFSKEFNAEKNAYSMVPYQNANHSIRVTDEFMEAVISDSTYATKEVSTGNPCEELNAREVLWKASEATWRCGDPGLQYDSTLNKWHTCKASGRINASNPCSEYVFLDNTACNLSSQNLMKFRNADGSFNTTAFCASCTIFTLAKEIIVDMASYPTEEMALRSHIFRTLGLGYANLGSLLMASGIPYDSDKGRHMAAGITALMTGQAYVVSALIAAHMGPFPGYKENKDSVLEVIHMHTKAAGELLASGVASAAYGAWQTAFELANLYGVRNAQTTVLAPTGTIGFMMDCDTTGVEPELAIVKYKSLVGGGSLKLVNNTVDMALGNLGYAANTISKWKDELVAGNGVEELAGLNPDHIAIFDTSFSAPGPNARSIHYSGHIKMMAAVQPFLSGAISKTINLPETATVQDIFDAYVESWKLGLKAVAVYRDNCKGSQPLSTRKEEKKTQELVSTVAPNPAPYRHKLPDTHRSITHKFDIGGHKGHVIVGLYKDGSPGEMFISMAKEGSTLSGIMDNFSVAISYAIQYGVPIERLIKKFSHTRFEPSGWSGDSRIGYAHSILDYIFRWLELEFVKKDAAPVQAPVGVPQKAQNVLSTPDAPPCPDCGSITVRGGTCYKCLNCGSTTGCS